MDEQAEQVRQSKRRQPEAAREDWLQASRQLTDCSDKVTAARGCWPLERQRLVCSVCVDGLMISIIWPRLRHDCLGRRQGPLASPAATSHKAFQVKLWTQSAW